MNNDEDIFIFDEKWFRDDSDEELFFSEKEIEYYDNMCDRIDEFFKKKERQKWLTNSQEQI